MKRKTDIWILCIGLILLAAGLYLIRIDSDPVGILRVLPFVFIGFGCGLFGTRDGEYCQSEGAERNL